MLKFKEGDRVVVNGQSPKRKGGKVGVVIAIEVDEELRFPNYWVRFDDGSKGLLDEAWLDPEPVG